MCICVRSSAGTGSSNDKILARRITTKPRPSVWWFEEEGLFNLDEEGKAEKQQCAIAASNIIRNFSFMPDNEVAMGQNRHCLETMFQCIEDYVAGITSWAYFNCQPCMSYNALSPSFYDKRRIYVLLY